MLNARLLRSLTLLIVSLGLLTSIARADFTKNIQVTLNTPAQAVTTWYYASCTQSLGVGSYSIAVAPTHGSLSYSTVSGPLPGCPAGSPDLPAAAAFYTWTDATSGASCDSFRVNFLLNGGVAEVIDVNVRLSTGRPLSITTTTLSPVTSGAPYSVQLNSAGPPDAVTWAVTSGSLPAGFSLSPSGVLSRTGTQLASPGTYTITVTASSSCQSVSQELTLTVAPENCASNANIDVTKIHVTPSTLWSQWYSGDYLNVQPGNRLILPFFNVAWPPYGIQISVDSDAVSYTGPSVPSGDVNFKFIQDLTAFSGYATYQEINGTPQTERMAILAELAANGADLVGPLVDDNGVNAPYYDQYQVLNDSPAVHAPFHDARGRSLTAMHYTKTFTAYYGCHTTADLTAYPITDSRHFLHTLAKITWGVNYFGRVARCFFCDDFTPDTSTGAPNTSTGPGVFYDPPVASPDERIVVAPPTANGSTNFICFAGGVCP